MNRTAPRSSWDVLRETSALPGDIALLYAQAQRRISLSVLTPVFNERHLVAASLARVLALESDLISRLELIVVDDCSDDGSWEILEQIASADSRVQLYRHHRNCGKGAAIRTALEHATGDVCIVHDADMEYNPADIPLCSGPSLKKARTPSSVHATCRRPTAAP